MNTLQSVTERLPRPRVVVTGLGMITALGHTVAETWHELLAGHSGLGPITQFNASAFPSQIAAEVKDFSSAPVIPSKEARRMSRSSQIAVVAASQAIKDADLNYPSAEGEEAGVVVGTGFSGMEQVEMLFKEDGGRG